MSDAPVVPLEPLEAPGGPAEPAASNGAAAWKRDKQGREYVPARGRRGLVYRQEGELVEHALSRDEAARLRPKDERPRRKATARKPQAELPPRPKSLELQEIEEALAEALRSPAIACALAGDEWAANHFTEQGPRLARNLIVASQHNPWLRRKLEAAQSGEEFALRVMTMGGLAFAVFGYLAPPIVWWANIPVSPKGRELLHIPPARAHAAVPLAETA